MAFRGKGGLRFLPSQLLLAYATNQMALLVVAAADDCLGVDAAGVARWGKPTNSRRRDVLSRELSMLIALHDTSSYFLVVD